MGPQNSAIQSYVCYESISACQHFWETFREYENKEQYFISYQMFLALIASSFTDSSDGTPVVPQVMLSVISCH